MSDPVGQVASETESLSNWAAPYVTNMLGKGQALSNMPFTAYSGQLTAGQSGLQDTAFQGLANLTMPTNMGGFNPMSFTGVAPIAPTAENSADSDAIAAVFAGADQAAQQAGGIANTFGIDPNVNTSGMTGVSFSGMNTAEDQAKAREMGLTPLQYAQAGGMGANVDQTAMSAAQSGMTPASQSVLQQYMTPYLQGALQPQYDAANRQALISAQNLQSQYGKAGAYGGSRQGIAEAELQRGLLDRMSGITGQGYQDAFTAAQNQFNTEQDRQMTAQQRTNQYGMDVLDAQQAGGATQRGIEGQGIAADYAQFTEERDYPFKQVQYQQSLLEGLPIGQTSRDFVDPSSSSEALGILGLLNELYAEYKKKD